HGFQVRARQPQDGERGEVNRNGPGPDDGGNEASQRQEPYCPRGFPNVMCKIRKCVSNCPGFYLQELRHIDIAWNHCFTCAGTTKAKCNQRCKYEDDYRHRRRNRWACGKKHVRPHGPMRMHPTAQRSGVERSLNLSTGTLECPGLSIAV